MMLHWHHAYAGSKKLVELLLKLDATHDIDVSSVAHGPEYKTNMSNFANHSYTSNGNYVGHNQESLPSQNYMAHDLNQPAGDDSVLPIPSDLFTSEAFNQYNVDQKDEGPEEEVEADDDAEVGLEKESRAKSVELVCKGMR